MESSCWRKPSLTLFSLLPCGGGGRGGRSHEHALVYMELVCIHELYGILTKWKIRFSEKQVEKAYKK